MNIPSIEELRNIAAVAGWKAETGMMLTNQVAAIRDAVVAILVAAIILHFYRL